MSGDPADVHAREAERESTVESSFARLVGTSVKRLRQASADMVRFPLRPRLQVDTERCAAPPTRQWHAAPALLGASLPAGLSRQATHHADGGALAPAYNPENRALFVQADAKAATAEGRRRWSGDLEVLSNLLDADSLGLPTAWPPGMSSIEVV